VILSWPVVITWSQSTLYQFIVTQVKSPGGALAENQPASVAYRECSSLLCFGSWSVLLLGRVTARIVP